MKESVCRPCYSFSILLIVYTSSLSGIKREADAEAEEEDKQAKKKKKIQKKTDEEEIQKTAAIAAEVQAAKERALIPLEIRMKQFKDMLLERGVSPF